MQNVPKFIWMMWFNGLEEAPDIVRACISSWRRRHPGWTLRVITRKNLHEFLDIEKLTGKRVDKLSIIVLSDIIRVNLLATYGGVWSDATCYCAKPLEEWLPEYMSSGFFAFRRPGPDREFSNWFLVAEPENLLIRRFRDRVNAYWREHDLSSDRYPALISWMNVRFNRNQATTRWWFSWFVVKVLKVHPYFWNHYLFAHLLRSDSECRSIWGVTPDFPASIPHMLQEVNGLLKSMPSEVRGLIDRAESPVFKLSWKFEPRDVDPASPIDYIINRERPFLRDLS
jgi:Capsular polysaccharide synthesis protein